GRRNEGVVLSGGGRLEPFPTDLDPLFKSGQLYRGAALPDGSYALTTTSSGAGILSRDGRRVAWTTRDTGLPTDTVYYALRDAEGALWMALDAGRGRRDAARP